MAYFEFFLDFKQLSKSVDSEQNGWNPTKSVDCQNWEDLLEAVGFR